MDTGTSSKQGAGLEGDEFHEIECELSEELFRSLDNSEESDGEVNAIDNVFQQTNLNKEGFKFEIGMIFKSADEFKWAVKCHEATRRKDIYFKKNEGRRVRVVCRHNDTCNWSIFASRSNPRSPFAIKTYTPEHTCGDQDENRIVNSGFLAKLYKDDFKINTEWGRIQFQEHVKAKLKCQAAEWLDARDAKHYCKAYFSTFPKTDLLLNNVCESWNGTILNFRDKPVLSMCEKLRIYLMTRMQKNRESIKSHTKKICPKICKLLEEEKDRACRYSTYKSNDNLYQVDDENFRKINPIEESKKDSTKLKARKVGEVKRCSVCGLKGHNKITCKRQNPQVAEMEDREAGMEQVVAEEVQVEGQFEDIAVETQVPSFVLDEMELRNSQPSQAVQNQAPSLSEFISAKLPSQSSTPNVITRSGRNYVTVATLQHSKAVQRETRKKRTTAKKK
nr:Zinc knuckle family protein [Ipomoea batatas]